MLNNEILAIGTYFINEETGTEESRRFTFEFSRKKFDEDCYRDFWSKHEDKLKVFEQEKVKTTIADFASYLDELDKKYDDLVIISDNPQFDIGFINYYFNKYLNRKPMSYKNNGTDYRLIVDQVIIISLF